MDNVTQLGSLFCPYSSILDCDSISHIDCALENIDSFFMNGICENIAILFVHYTIALICIWTVPAYIVKLIIKGLYKIWKTMGGYVSTRKSSVQRRKSNAADLTFRKPNIVVTSPSPTNERSSENENTVIKRSSLKIGTRSSSKINRDSIEGNSQNSGEQVGFTYEYEAENVEIAKEADEKDEKTSLDDKWGIEALADRMLPDHKNLNVDTYEQMTHLHLETSQNYRVANRDFLNEIKNFHFRTKTLILHRESGNEKITELITVPVPKPRLSLLQKAGKTNDNHIGKVNAARCIRPVPKPRTVKPHQLQDCTDVDPIQPDNVDNGNDKTECADGSNENISSNSSNTDSTSGEDDDSSVDTDSFCIIPNYTPSQLKEDADISLIFAVPV